MQLSPAKWWNYQEASDRVVCTLCPKECKLREGQRGFCYLRLREGKKLKTEGYGTTSGMAVDPVEKKPLNHFLPNTKILSLGNMGCNLACKFCQNWSISKAKETPVRQLSSMDLVQLARRYDCQSVAFTYNDPVIWAEFAMDSSWKLAEHGIHPVLVTAGYISKEARKELFQPVKAINFDLKAFNADFYFKLTNSSLKDVLDTLLYTREQTGIWMELTHLVIPGANDSDKEYLAMLDWIEKYLGKETVLHLTAFHPDWKMKDVPATKHSDLIKKYDQAKEWGFPWVYLGNVFDPKRQTTICNNCESIVIERNWHKTSLSQEGFQGNCMKCNTVIPGYFGSQEIRNSAC